MILTLFVSIFSIKYTLQSLGEEDYGIYNIITSIISLLSIFSIPLNTSLLKFLTQSLVSRNIERYNESINTIFTLNIVLSTTYILIILPILIIFKNSYINIPLEKSNISTICLIISTFSFIVNSYTTTINTLFTAHENFQIIGKTALFENGLKIVYLIVVSQITNYQLIIVASLNLIISLLVLYFSFYTAYNRKFITKIKLQFHNAKEVFSFTSWSILGSTTSTINDHGITTLMSVYFNPTIIANRSIAYKISSTINAFSINFYSTINPKIFKTYNQNDNNNLYSLIKFSTKVSFSILTFSSILLLIFSENIFNILSVSNNELINSFTFLFLIYNIVNTFESPLTTAVRASGKIKAYQITNSLIMLTCLPVSYILFDNKLSPETSIYVIIFTTIFSLFFRLIIVNKITQIPITKYFNEIILPCFLTIIINIVHINVLKKYMSTSHPLISLILTVIISAITIFSFLLSNEEKAKLITKIKKIIRI